MSATFFSNLNNVNYALNNAQIPTEGPKALPSPLQFGGGITTYSVDFSQAVNTRQISFIQGVFVDNSTNTAALTIVVQGTFQKIVVPAGEQMYVPILAYNPPIFIVSSAASTALVPMFWYNVPISPIAWSSTGSSSLSGFTFTGNNLNTQDAGLDAIISGGGLNVNVISGGSGLIRGSEQTWYTGLQNPGNTVIFNPSSGKVAVLDWLKVSIDVTAYASTGVARNVYLTLYDFSGPIGNYGMKFPAYVGTAAPVIAAGSPLAAVSLIELSDFNLKMTQIAINVSDQLAGGGFNVSFGAHSE